ncbi:hypothetical protein, partial [Klebsiella aerogenes]
MLLLEGQLRAQGGAGQDGGRLQVRLDAGLVADGSLPPQQALTLAAANGNLTASLTPASLGAAAQVNPLAR